MEIGLNYPVLPGFTLYFTQTFSNFKYRSYQVNTTQYDRNSLPGIPKLNTQLELRYFHHKGFFALVQARQVGKVYANDANTAAADAYLLLNLRLGNTFSFKSLQVEPYIGLNNVTDARYAANVQINGANDRYFEPASRRSIWGGMKLRVR